MINLGPPCTIQVFLAAKGAGCGAGHLTSDPQFLGDEVRWLVQCTAPTQQLLSQKGRHEMPQDATGWEGTLSPIWKWNMGSLIGSSPIKNQVIFQLVMLVYQGVYLQDEFPCNWGNFFTEP